MMYGLEQKHQKKVHLETWGCQMNVADSERMLSILKAQCYEETLEAEDADLIILNTCHIREKSRHKVISRLGVLKELKKRKPHLTIAVTGCVAQAEGKKLLEYVPQIDILLGPGKVDEIGDLLQEHQKTKSQKISVGFSLKAEEPEQLDSMSCQIGPSLYGKNDISRFVTIQKGCNNFCTFCVVPFTRGREISEKPERVEAMVKGYLKIGAKEITLLGQNVNSYGLDFLDAQDPFVHLLKRLCLIEDLKRLRITTSNPHDLTRSLADLYGQEEKLGRYFHLPVQSGSGDILEKMKRKITKEDYLTKLSWLRHKDPFLAVSTDLIVGFPGETEEDFEQTLDLVQKAQFSFIFAFMYSPRKNTAAIRFRDQVPEEVKSQRLARLHALQDPISLKEHERQMGKTRQVLYLYKSQKEDQVYYGRDEYFHLVRTQSPRHLVGELLPVKITAFHKTNISGELC